jgi:bacterioferritin
MKVSMTVAQKSPIAQQRVVRKANSRRRGTKKFAASMPVPRHGAGPFADVASGGTTALLDAVPAMQIAGAALDVSDGIAQGIAEPGGKPDAPGQAPAQSTALNAGDAPCLDDGALAASTPAPPQGAAPRAELSQEETVQLLNEALAIQIACVSSYRRHNVIADSMAKSASATLFLGYASDGTDVATWLAMRIAELGGTPDAELESSEQCQRPDLADAPSLQSMITSSIAAERAAIDTYMRILTHVGESDLTTKFLVDENLFDALQRADEFQHWPEV